MADKADHRRCIHREQMHWYSRLFALCIACFLVIRRRGKECPAVHAHTCNAAFSQATIQGFLGLSLVKERTVANLNGAGQGRGQGIHKSPEVFQTLWPETGGKLQKNGAKHIVEWRNYLKKVRYFAASATQ